MIFCKKMISFFILILLSNSVFSDQQSTFDESLGWAKSINKKAETTNFNVNEYCENNQCETPSEMGLSEGELESKAANEFITNDNAQLLSSSFSNGSVDVANDPTYRSALTVQNNAFEITYGINNEYVDCDSGTICNLIQTQSTCKQPTNNTVGCTEHPVVSNVSGQDGSTVFEARNTAFLFNGFSYSYYNRATTFNLPENVNRVNSLYISDAIFQYKKDLKIYINGTLVYTGNKNQSRRCVKDRNNGHCKEYSSDSIHNIGPITLTSPIAVLNNKVEITSNVGEVRFQSTGYLKLGWSKYLYDINWVNSCSTLIPECKPVERKCTKEGEAKAIDGVVLTLPCWEYTTYYDCEISNTCTETPNCTIATTHCSLLQNGTCIENTISKSCETKSCETQVLSCGEETFCLNGDCSEGEAVENTEFDKAVSSLAAVAAAGSDYGDPPTIFGGKPLRCSRDLVNAKDCCKADGWVSGSIASCDQEEETLGRARESKLAIYVGNHCSKKVLGVCLKKKETYCVYDSKIAKIIQQQGSKSQLGLSNGTSSNPKCEPITPEQLQLINFDLVDFSDFYGDLKSGVNLPNTDEIKERIKSSYGAQ